MTFGFFAWTAWNADSGMFIALSSWCWDISRPLFCGEPASTQIRRLGSGRAWKPVLAPHQFGSMSYTNCVALAMVNLHGPVPSAPPFARHDTLTEAVHPPLRT